MNIRIGSHIGNWEVISERFKEDRIYKNTCKCICGTIRNVPSWHLNNNKSKGCGCTNIIGRFRSQCVGDLSKSYYNRFKTGREKKGLIFDSNITMEYLWNLFLEQNKKCALSGLELILNPRWSQQNKGRMENVQTASIDRIDNTKGYILGNVQWVHKQVNFMKGSLSENKFIEYCNLIVKNYEKI